MCSRGEHSSSDLKSSLPPPGHFPAMGLNARGGLGLTSSLLSSWFSEWFRPHSSGRSGHQQVPCFSPCHPDSGPGEQSLEWALLSHVQIMCLFLEDHVGSWVGKVDFLKEAGEMQKGELKYLVPPGITYKVTHLPPRGAFSGGYVSFFGGGGGQQILVEYRLWSLSHVSSYQGWGRGRH